MTVWSALDAAGRRRSPATLPGYHAGRPPRNKGMCYPADPPTVEEIVAVMRHAPDDRHGWRVRAMIVVRDEHAEPVRRRHSRTSSPSKRRHRRTSSAAPRSALRSARVHAPRPSR